MIFTRWLRGLFPLCLSLLLLITACTPRDASPYAKAQQESTRRGAPAAVVKAAEQGGTFNQFFPGSQGSYTVIPAQEKKGFAEYKLNKDGNTLAMLSISDTTSIPSAAAKYRSALSTIAGYPTVEQGATATGLLVNDRYQVKVLSRDPSFTQDDRIAWLQKFDLRGLATLEPALTAKASPTQPAAPTPSKPTALPNAIAPPAQSPAVQTAPPVPQLQPAA